MSSFDIRKTNITKGIAVLLLICHHVFYDYFYGLKEINQIFIFQECARILTQHGAICIFIFSAVSGYGVYEKLKKEKVGECILKRELGMLGTFIPIYIIGFFTVWIDRGVGYIEEIYGTTLGEKFAYILLDMLGLSGAFGTNKLNASWWYLPAAHYIILLTPILIYFCKKTKAFLGVWMFLFLYLAGHQDDVYLCCVFSAFIGAMLNHYNILDYFSNCKYPMRMVSIIFAAVLIYIYYVLSQIQFLNWYYLASVFGPVVLFWVSLLFANLPGINFFLEKVGKYGGPIYMSHTFIFSILPTISTFVYKFDMAFVTYLLVLGLSFLFVFTLDQVERLCGYKKLISKIKDMISCRYREN